MNESKDKPTITVRHKNEDKPGADCSKQLTLKNPVQ